MSDDSLNHRLKKIELILKDQRADIGFLVKYLVDKKELKKINLRIKTTQEKLWENYSGFDPEDVGDEMVNRILSVIPAERFIAECKFTTKEANTISRFANAKEIRISLRTGRIKAHRNIGRKTYHAIAMAMLKLVKELKGKEFDYAFKRDLVKMGVEIVKCSECEYYTPWFVGEELPKCINCNSIDYCVDKIETQKTLDGMN